MSTETLVSALMAEQRRVRELLPIYREIGPPGAYAVAMMEGSLRAADVAIGVGDTIAMIRSLEDLRGYKE